MTTVRVYINGAVNCKDCGKPPVFIINEASVEIAECDNGACSPVIFRDETLLETAMLQWNKCNVVENQQTCSD